MPSTSDIGQGSDNIVESKRSDGMDGFEVTAIDQDEELIKETEMNVNTT